MRALDEHRPGDAVSILSAYLQTSPADAHAHAYLGVALAKLNLTAAAIESLERAHYLRPDSPQILYNYGLALKAVGRTADAQIRFAAALRLNPRYEPALRQLGVPASPAGLSAHPAAPGPPTTSAPFTEALVAMEPPGTSVPVPDSPIALGTGPVQGSELVPALPVPEEPAQAAGLLPELTASTLQPEQDTASTFEFDLKQARPLVEPDPASRFAGRDNPFIQELEEAQAADAEEPRPLPGLVGLAQATLQLWGEQPLLWIALLVPANLGAALLTPPGVEFQWAAALLWAAALGVSVAAVLRLMAGHWVHGSPFTREWPFTFGRLVRGIAVALPYSLLTTGGVAAAMAVTLPATADRHLLVALLLLTPLHALLAPALVTSATDGEGGAGSVVEAFQLATRRAWLHWALFLTVGTLVGAIVVLIYWGLAAVLDQSGIEHADWAPQVLGVSLAESVWAALVTICGVDSLTAIAASSEDDAAIEGMGGEGADPGAGALDGGELPANPRPSEAPQPAGRQR